MNDPFYLNSNKAMQSYEVWKCAVCGWYNMGHSWECTGCTTLEVGMNRRYKTTAEWVQWWQEQLTKEQGR